MLERFRSRAHSLSSGLLAAALSTTLIVLVLDLVASPWLFPLIPLKLHAAIPRGARLLAQSSKAAAVPRDWIAILGDSYAQGAGDWMLTVDPNRNPPFHTAHLLRDRTGRDVMTFGASGAGSLRALVTEPIAGLDFLRQTALFATQNPDLFLVYFYEGNDVNDNVLDLEMRFAPHFDLDRIRDPVLFREFLETVVIAKSAIGLDASSFHWWDNFFLTRGVIRGIGALILRRWPEDLPLRDWSAHDVNRAVMAGSIVSLPDRLQSPALDLDEDELDRGLYVFEQAFAYLRERFARIPTLVVYIPSPLTSYRIASDRVSIEVQREGRADLYDRTQLWRRSEIICGRVAAATRKNGGGFLDIRAALWPVSDHEFVHGPRDWKHLNRRGQEAMTDAIVARIGAGVVSSSGDCISTVR